MVKGVGNPRMLAIGSGRIEKRIGGSIIGRGGKKVRYLNNEHGVLINLNE